MKKGGIFVLLVLLTNLVSSQIIIPKSEYVPEVGRARYSFTISLIAASHTSLVSYGIMRQNPDSTREVMFLTFGTFIRQLSGNETSLANPEKINYLETYGLSVADFENLWKLKYDEYPYGMSQEKGYGTKNGTPTKAQYEMLKPFGISKKPDHCFGDNLWKFMLKVKDPNWIAQYQMRN